MVEDEVVLAARHRHNVDVCAAMVDVHNVINNVRATITVCRCGVLGLGFDGLPVGVLRLVLVCWLCLELMHRNLIVVELFQSGLSSEGRTAHGFYLNSVNVGRFGYSVHQLVLAFIRVVIGLDGLQVDVALAGHRCARSVIVVGVHVGTDSDVLVLAELAWLCMWAWVCVLGGYRVLNWPLGATIFKCRFFVRLSYKAFDVFRRPCHALVFAAYLRGERDVVWVDHHWFSLSCCVHAAATLVVANANFLRVVHLR